jgi:hypothetical protein
MEAFPKDKFYCKITTRGIKLPWNISTPALSAERNRNTWEVVGFRPKTAVSTFGKFIVKRRLDKNKKTGETRFFLDAFLFKNF